MRRLGWAVLLIGVIRFCYGVNYTLIRIWALFRTDNRFNDAALWNLISLLHCAICAIGLINLVLGIGLIVHRRWMMPLLLIETAALLISTAEGWIELSFRFGHEPWTLPAIADMVSHYLIYLVFPATMILLLAAPAESIRRTAEVK